LELFSESERNIVEAEFPDVPGTQVNWGRVRWRGRGYAYPVSYRIIVGFSRIRA
jgi:hypothetical protein